MLNQSHKRQENEKKDCGEFPSLAVQRLSAYLDSENAEKSLENFILSIIKSAKPPAEVLVNSLKIAIEYYNLRNTCDLDIFRVFAGSLIISSKFLMDSSFKNCQWAKHLLYYSVAEINLIEMHFLDAFGFDFNFIKYRMDEESPHKKYLNLSRVSLPDQFECVKSVKNFLATKLRNDRVIII